MLKTVNTFQKLKNFPEWSDRIIIPRNALTISYVNE